MSRHTKEKRKIQKRKLEAQIKEEQTVFDVLGLLETENTETKPNMAKFLKNYVKIIAGNPVSKPMFYPVLEMPINKWFVQFMDEHELIFDTTQKDDKYRYILCCGYDDIELDAKGFKLIKTFFDRLFEFRFIGDWRVPIQQKAPELSGVSCDI